MIKKHSVSMSKSSERSAFLKGTANDPRANRTVETVAHAVTPSPHFNYKRSTQSTPDLSSFSFSCHLHTGSVSLLDASHIVVAALEVSSTVVSIETHLSSSLAPPTRRVLPS